MMIFTPTRSMIHQLSMSNNKQEQLTLKLRVVELLRGHEALDQSEPCPVTLTGVLTGRRDIIGANHGKLVIYTTIITIKIR